MLLLLLFVVFVVVVVVVVVVVAVFMIVVVVVVVSVAVAENNFSALRAKKKNTFLCASRENANQFSSRFAQKSKNIF